jgi:predicted amidophosphoribosyltransferase
MNVPGKVRPVEGISVARPPLPGPLVCEICRGPSRAGSGFCWCCRKVSAALGVMPASLPHVLPIAVFGPGDPWSICLRRYKDAPGVAARRHFANVLATEAERSLAIHGDCLREETGGFDAYCVVPTSRPQARATGRHPLEAVMADVDALSALELVRLVPSAPTAHLDPSPGAFVAGGESLVAGKRVLVVEDCWVTGARALSAVVALSRAGASVTGVLVLGRSVDPSASSASGSWWVRFGYRSGFTDGSWRCSHNCLATSPPVSRPGR